MIATAIAPMLVWLAHACWFTGVDVVTVTTEGGAFGSGNSATVILWIEVRDGYHIQANQVDDESLVPTTVELDAEDMVLIKRLRYPRPKRFRLEGTDSFLRVYDGKFPVKLWLVLGADAERGPHMIKAHLRYQACDARTCLFPRVAEFEIPVEISRK